ncbi:SMC-Scp complex subunit ScpB [Allorhodopirellula solitaria]|uniref:Segregation and condensation protein B n=1 Tax=Allorhodopirellula solitaria TaxID=2527987 RepID=A0A5C5XPF9_9BACT|nr:SMC-Scp complex subunit ScpB [Allorhodopirellula solitaria]TWT64794.1 Segregation and condensation protein B [Allorhodopirellula solitaria]
MNDSGNRVDTPEDDDDLVDDNQELDADFDDDEDAFSLEELGAAYQHLVADGGSDDNGTSMEIGEVLQREHLVAAQASGLQNADGDSESDPDDPDEAWQSADEQSTAEIAASPEAIIEAALFVGNPNGNGITAARLASIMRDMTPEEVIETIDSLQTSYREHRQGIRIAEDETGYRLIVAPEAESMRHVFTGKVRETKLAQAAIEVLAMVAYQPGITAAECTDKRGRDSGPLLNQMVRRRLIEVRREPAALPDAGSETATDSPPAKAKKKASPKLVSKFYPAERLLVLLGLDSLDDLPQVEEVHLQ